MSKQRIIKDEMWDDEWFYELDPVEKLVWVFLLTNPRNNIAGVYQLSRRYGANSTGLDRDVFDNIMARFEQHTKVILLDEWVIIHNFHRHQSSNPKVEAGVVRILESLPQKVVMALPIDSLCIAYPTLLNSTLLNLSETKQSLDLINKGKDMPFNKYSDDYEEGVVDLDGDGGVFDPSEVEKEKDKDRLAKKNAMIDWLITHQGRDPKKTNRPKQMKALNELIHMKVSQAEVKQSIMEMEGEPYWQKVDHLPDFRSVVSRIQGRGR